MAGWRQTDEDGQTRVLGKTVSSLSVKELRKIKMDVESKRNTK